MRIYFSGIAEERNFLTDNKKYNTQIVSSLRILGHEVIEDDSDTDSLFFDHRDFAGKLSKCDCFIAEVTGTSTRQGYQICYSERKLLTYVFYNKTKEKKLSFIILGDPNTYKIPYTEDRDISNLVRVVFPFKKPVKKFEQLKLVV